MPQRVTAWMIHEQLCIRPSIPLLDLGCFDAGEIERAAFLADLRAAAHEARFF